MQPQVSKVPVLLDGGHDGIMVELPIDCGPVRRLWYSIAKQDGEHAVGDEVVGCLVEGYNPLAAESPRKSGRLTEQNQSLG